MVFSWWWGEGLLTPSCSWPVVFCYDWPFDDDDDLVWCSVMIGNFVFYCVVTDDVIFCCVGVLFVVDDDIVVDPIYSSDPSDLLFIPTFGDIDSRWSWWRDDDEVMRLFDISTFIVDIITLTCCYWWPFWWWWYHCCCCILLLLIVCWYCVMTNLSDDSVWYYYSVMIVFQDVCVEAVVLKCVNLLYYSMCVK